MDELCQDAVQIVVLGTGDVKYENMFRISHGSIREECPQIFIILMNFRIRSMHRAMLSLCRLCLSHAV